MPRPRRTTTMLLAGLTLGAAGCNYEPAPVPPTQQVPPQAWTAPPESVLQGSLSPESSPAPKVTQVVKREPRLFRLPPPPEHGAAKSYETFDEATTTLDAEPVPLLELLPPIQEEELAGDRGVLEFEAPDQIVVAEEVVEELELPPTPELAAEVNAELPGEVAAEARQPRREIAADLPAPSHAYEVDEFDEDAAAAAATSVDELMAYYPAEDQLSTQFRPRVQEAFTLARHGALHAAQARFEQLLLELAQSKDASQMTDRHTRSLDAGLRALAEADDFAQCSGGKIRPKAIAAGHQTPMLHETNAEWTLAHEATAMYHLYAQQKLAAAVKGEQSGSMMLFGMGKLYAQMAARDNAPQAIRKSLTLYRSAVVAHSHNYLAANEAGVLLARAGRYPQSLEMLEHSVKLANASGTHRNLAFVHGKLEQFELAQMHEQAAIQLAQHEISRGQFSAERGIQWVSPDDFNRMGSSEPVPSVASAPSATQQPPAPQSAPTKQARPQTTWW